MCSSEVDAHPVAPGNRSPPSTGVIMHAPSIESLANNDAPILRRLYDTKWSRGGRQGVVLHLCRHACILVGRSSLDGPLPLVALVPPHDLHVVLAELERRGLMIPPPCARSQRAHATQADDGRAEEEMGQATMLLTESSTSQ